MCETLSGLFGAIIGGLLALAGSYIASRHMSKIELKKLSLAYLMDKKNLIEDFLNKSSYVITGPIEDDQASIMDEFYRIEKFMQAKAHYFLDSEVFHNCRYKLNVIINDKDNQAYLYDMRELNNDFNRFISNELEKTVRQIHVLIDIK